LHLGGGVDDRENGAGRGSVVVEGERVAGDAFGVDANGV
jgi:hypothetical protein